MQKRYRLSLFLIVLVACLNLQAQKGFVTTRGNQLFVDGQPYYYIGTNYWYGGLLALDGEQGIKRLEKELDFLKTNGITNLRVLVGAEGTGMINGNPRVSPPLQDKKGSFIRANLVGLDYLLAEMSKRNMKAVLILSNHWEWSGGFLQYLNWNGMLSDSVMRKKMEWDDMRDHISRFYTCLPCKSDYLKQVDLLLSRKNTVTGKPYLADAAIMAWELANEPRPMRPSANEAYAAWIRDVASYIKKKDRRHLVTLGHEGWIGTQSIALYEKIHADPNVDYLTIHIWPKNWAWYSDTTIAGGMDSILNKTNSYIDDHISLAVKLDKPLVIEEFGLPRDNQAFDPASSTSLRDQYFRDILSLWSQQKNASGVIAGVNFWAFGGTARPIKGQVFWKPGDAYMGDPPMEEQGLNTIFDSDSSTWRLIRAFSK